MTDFDFGTIVPPPVTSSLAVDQAIQSDTHPTSIEQAQAQEQELEQLEQGGKPWFQVIAEQIVPVVAARWTERGWEIVILDPPENPLTNHQRNLLFRSMSIAVRRHRAKGNFSSYLERRQVELKKQQEVQQALEESARAGLLDPALQR
jgi:hypothetical protein